MMKYRIIGAAIAVLFLIGAAGSIFVLTAKPKKNVRVVSDGKTVFAADLNNAEDRTFTVEYDGHENTVEIKDGKIRVKDADCPDKTCVRMGWLESSAMPIVCLPHRLVIEFTDDSGDIDALTR